MKAKNSNKGRRRGPIEILLIIALIAIPLGLAFVVFSPDGETSDAHDIQRYTDINSIIDAIRLYVIDNDGAFPSGIVDGGAYRVLGTNVTRCDVTCGTRKTSGACLDLSTDLIPRYLFEIPQDPISGTPGDTGYYIKRVGNVITVGACSLDELTPIEVQR
ncbi:MAG: hypothetical protein WD883_00665 [Candidatus Colwellbacteria bacterium]